MSAEPSREPVTVASMFTPAVIQRRVQRMAEQRFALDCLLPPVPLTRRQRVARAWKSRRDQLRESLALKVAPWLDNHGSDW